MSEYLLRLSELPNKSLARVGSKARNLGALISAGIVVPDGFCLTTTAFRRFLDSCPGSDDLYGRLACATAYERIEVGGQFRKLLTEVPVPPDISAGLIEEWHRIAEGRPCAVRSSATAEDLRSASFAGQYDTFLNVVDEQQLLDRVRQCWLSVFTDRAIDYRARLGIDHREVELAVVVQLMVPATVAGVLFTADPITGQRGITVINAAFGLGESVVSGSVNPDLYTIDPNGAVHKSISTKAVAIEPDATGGTATRELSMSQRGAQALPDTQIRELAAIGQRIEAHFGEPQDIEWAWSDAGIAVLQSRPITSLFPVPDQPADGRLHLYFSFGHQQMMTEAITPLGQSVLRTYFPFGRRTGSGESTQMVTAGNRVFFDYTEPLHTPLARRVLAWAVGSMDARVGYTVREFAARSDFQTAHRPTPRRELAINMFVFRAAVRVLADLLVSDLTQRHAAIHVFAHQSLATAQAATSSSSGADRIAAIQSNMHAVTPRIVDQLVIAPMSALIARQLVDRLSLRWLGDTDDVGPLDKGLPGNVTAEMGLEIGDLADLVRGRPELRRLLESPPEPFNLDQFDAVPGGAEFRVAFGQFLDHFGMRGPGEIDIARPRWADEPTTLFTSILANTQTTRPGEHRERFHAAADEAAAAVDRLLVRVRATRLGFVRVRVMSRLIRVHRTLMALREHQKFLTVRLFDIYRTAVKAEVDTLVQQGHLRSAEDADYLTLDELRQMLRGRVPSTLDETIAARRADFESSTELPVPRLFTSDGEVIAMAGVARHVEGVLVGNPVSAGVVEGRARIVVRPQDATFEEGDILVARFADPAWTPLFSAVRGVVLEVGGVMAHGAVVAREMGIPAVVGIDNATTLIADGELIRVDGTRGIVESLKSPVVAATA